MSGLPPVLSKKSLGQNFLIDPNLARKLIDALHPSPDETVLEIGPGGGSLTAPLLERTTRLIAVEIDDRLIPFLHERFGQQLTLLQADILDIDLTDLAQKSGGPLAVIGNLPYYSSSPILFHLLAHRRALSRIVVTLQSEMVDRCCATVGGKEYGSVSVQLQVYASLRRLFNLSPNVFRPRPQVTSAALEADFCKPLAPLPKSDRHLERIVRAAFSRRRKMLHNSLAGGLGQECAARLLTATGLDGSRRAEQLSPAEFVLLADALCDQESVT